MTATAETTVLDKRSVTGTVWVAGGLAILGAAGYLFVTLTAKLDPASAAALSSLYLLTAVIGPGIFGAFELETSRLTASKAAIGEPSGAVIRQLGVLSASALGIVLIVLLGLSPVLTPRVFNGNPVLVISLCAIACGYAIGSFPRGMLAGSRRLPGFASVLAAEGLLRLIPTVLLFAAGVTLASVYGLVWGLASLLAALAAVAFIHPDRTGETMPWRQLITASGSLLASMLLALAVANLGPVIVTALLTTDKQRAAIFAFAFVLFRTPHFIFNSLQTVLLPMFSRASAQGDVAGLRKAIKQAMLIVVGFGLAAGLVIWAAAPFVMRIPFPGVPALSWQLLALLAVGNAGFMLVQQVLQPAMLAVHGHRTVALAWTAGIVAFGLSFTLPVDPVHAALVAQFSSFMITGAILYIALKREGV